MSLRILCCLLVCGLVCPAVSADEAKKGKRYALVVGVSDYDHDSLKTLEYTENDANGLADLLREGGFDEVVLLTSTRGKKDAKARPTAANLRAQLKRLLDRVKRDDLVIVGLAGHGLQLRVEDPKTKKEKEESFFCPSDARPKRTKDFAELAKTMIPLTWLFEELEESGAGVKLMLVDACRDDPKLGRNLDTDHLPRPPRGSAVLFSCKGGERAFETQKLKHGVFFHYVIEGLKGKAKNDKGDITWSRLVDYVVENVSEQVPLVIGDGARQTPQELKNLTGKSPILIGPGGTETLFRQGIRQNTGMGAIHDPAAASRSFETAAKRGHKLASAHFGMFQRDGVGTEPDMDAGLKRIKAALPEVRAKAKEGDADARDLLAMLLRRGLGVQIDNAAAVKLYEQLVAQGDVRGMIGLGNMYHDGLSVEKDGPKAVEWYRKAADKGSPIAAGELAWRYDMGHAVKADQIESTKWFRKAAAQGAAFSDMSLGMRYAAGKGVEKDEAEALKCFVKAAEGGDGYAIARLIAMYSKGMGGVKQDDAEVRRWRRKGESMDVTQQSKIGYCFNYGYHVDRDHAEAMRWYRKAADRGSSSALTSIGNMYRFAYGVTKDGAETMKYYRQAAEKGDPYSLQNVAEAYLSGELVTRDEKEAVVWLRKASEAGQGQAMALLSWMLRNGYGTTKNEKEADEWFRRGSDAMGAFSLGSAAWNFAYGFNLPRRDEAEAMRWYRVGAARGDGRSLFQLGEVAEKAGNKAEALRLYRLAAQQDAFGAKEAVKRLGGE